MIPTTTEHASTRARTSPIRLVTVGDIGSVDAYHVGDEAMLLGLMQDVATTGAVVEWTVMAARPERWSPMFGSPAVPRLTFSDCASPADREARLQELDRILAEPPDAWSRLAPLRWRETLTAITRNDAVVIAGGGNLCRTWPDQVAERVAVARAARRAGRPVVITGQTLGPVFDARTRELTAEVLAAAALVGIRETHSHRLALELGVPAERLMLQFDDAIGLKGVEPSGASSVGDGPFIAVTLNPLDDLHDPAGIVPRLAAQLTELGRATGATVVLVPHVGDLDGERVQDVAMADAIVSAAGNRTALRIAPLPSPAEAVWYSEHAQLVVSTRYHPVVFAIGAGTPALFLYQDHYTLVKGRGALALAGLDGWVLSVGLAALGLLVPAAVELWNRRDSVRNHLRSIAPAIEASRRQHVTALLRAVDPLQTMEAFAEPIVRRGPNPSTEWVERASDAMAVLAATRAEVHAR